MYNNEKRQGLNKYESEDNRYISLPFNTPYFLTYKESNRLTDLGKRIKNLNYLV